MTDKLGQICWNELMTHDLTAAKAYYTDVLGWTIVGQDMPMGFTYWLAMDGDVPHAGIMDMSGNPQMKDVPPHWHTYIAVGDVDAVAAATAQAGGTIMDGPFDVPTVGRIAIVRDPCGAVLGLMTPSAQGASQT